MTASHCSHVGSASVTATGSPVVWVGAAAIWGPRLLFVLARAAGDYVEDWGVGVGSGAEVGR